MSLKVSLSVLALLSMVEPSISADVPAVMTGVNGVWSTADGCHRLKLSKINPNALWEKDYEDISYLDGSGINGYEWSCKFVKGFEGKAGDDVYLSDCELEGEHWTDILKLESLGTNGWQVTALDSDNRLNTITYDTMCKGSK